ncbi:MAG: Arm DNA-binding domain-containing protein, partial [Bacteroidia bacterium]
MASITFNLNRAKTDKEGLVPIYLQFTDKSNRFRLYTGEKVPEKFWKI